MNDKKLKITYKRPVVLTNFEKIKVMQCPLCSGKSERKNKKDGEPT